MKKKYHHARRGLMGRESPSKLEPKVTTIEIPANHIMIRQLKQNHPQVYKFLVKYPDWYKQVENYYG